MRLASAANHANKMECLDAYTGRLAFFAQLGLYDDTKRDSEAGERRVISVAPAVALPARKVVSCAGTRFIMGHGNPDTFKGRIIRIGYVGHEATHLATVQTLGEACRDEVGLAAWAGRAWIKRSADNEDSADLVGQFHIHFSTSEPVLPGMLVTFGAIRHVVRAVHDGPAGTRIAFCDEQPEPCVEVGTLQTGAYDPVFETVVAGTQSVRVLRARWQSLYEYRSTVAPKFGPMDLQIVIATAVANPRVGARITLSDGVWQIDACHQEGDVWMCRGVRGA